MAEGSSSSESNTPSDDSIIKNLQQTMLAFILESRKDDQEHHKLNPFISVDQINDPNVKKVQSLGKKNDTQITNFNNLSQIYSIDEKKGEQDVGFAEGLNRNEKPEIKKEKRHRKKGKGLKKQVDDDFERINVCDCDKRGDRVRVVYTREQIEGLRDVGMEQQKKKWIEVYCRLGSAVAKEYDGLAGLKHDKVKGNYVNFDPRPQFADKKGVAADFVGDGSENISCEMQNMNQVDTLSGVNVDDVDGEEDYYEDEDSDSEYSIQRPALYITGEPDFDSGPPQDGLEYLRRVIWEARRIPKVKIAKVGTKVINKEQTVYMPNIPDIAACPEHLMPSKEWEDVFLADFSKLRLELSEFESSGSTFSDQNESIPLAQSIIANMIQENFDLCQTDDGTTTDQENLDVNQTDGKTTTCDLPSLRTIMEMEPRARVTMLRKRIISMEQMSYLGQPDCAWLFALCAAIDTPLDADTSASLRCLLRKCATLRAEKASLDDEVIMLNILATVSGKYFGQLETN